MPAEFIAVHVTLVLPNANVEPETGVHVTVGVLTISVAVGVVYVTAAPAELVASAVISLLGAIVDGVVSRTITSNDDEAELPAVSLAVHVILVSPNANVEPEIGVHVATLSPSTASCVAG